MNFRLLQDLKKHHPLHHLGKHLKLSSKKINYLKHKEENFMLLLKLEISLKEKKIKI
jgi:hypothetical protein